MLREPPPASSRSTICRQYRVYGGLKDISGDEIVMYATVCRKDLKPDRYAITLTEFHMVGEWIEAFTLSGFVVMPYLYKFVSNPKTVLKRILQCFQKISSSMLSSPDTLVFFLMGLYASLKIDLPIWTPLL